MATERMKPTSTQFNDGFTVVGASTVHEAMDDDPGPPASPDDATTHIYRSSTTARNIRCGIEPMPSATSIVSLTVYARGYNWATPSDGWRLGVYVNSTYYWDAYRTNTSWQTYSKSWTTNPATSNPWTKDEVDDVEVCIQADGDDPTIVKYFTMIFAEVEYTPLPAQIEDTRTVGSQILRLRRRPPRTATQTAPLWFLNEELLSNYALSHFAWPDAGGAGAGAQRWQRRNMKLLRSELNLESMNLKVTGYDQRPYLTRWWDIGRSMISANQTADGIARLGVGTRSFSRSSKAWIPSPGDGRIVPLADDEEKFAEKGMLIERSSTNYVKNSCFSAGVLSNWSAIASASISADTTNLLFDTDVTPRSAKVSGNSGDGYQQTATASVVNGGLVFSFDVRGSAGTWDLKRATDSWYWNDSGKTWQSGRPGNSFSAYSSFDDDNRVISEPITLVGSTTTFAIEFRLTGTGNFSIAHVQLERAVYWASSRIVTTGATAVTRSADDLAVSNNTDARTIFASRGSFKCEFIPLWNSADVPSAWNLVVFQAYYDADNHQQFYYSNAAGQWIYRHKVNATTYTATKTASVTRGTTYSLGARWTSEEGELGLSNYTLSVFVDGVKGTDVTAGAAPTTTATADLDIGKIAALDGWIDGYLRQIDSVPYVLTDEEMAR